MRNQGRQGLGFGEGGRDGVGRVRDDVNKPRDGIVQYKLRVAFIIKGVVLLIVLLVI